MIVFGSMEATLTPLMEAIERAFAGIKVFSLPSVDHPEWGRHIELGVKGAASVARRRLRPACARGFEASAASSAPNWCVSRARTIQRRCVAPHRKGELRPGGDWHAFC